MGFFFKRVYVYSNEEDTVREYYSCLKMMKQAHLHVAFFLKKNNFSLSVHPLNGSIYI